MKLKTDTGVEIDVEFADVSSISENLLISVKDDRPIQNIAYDFDGAAVFECQSDQGWSKTFEGYTEMQSIVRRKGTVLLSFTKPKEV